MQEIKENKIPTLVQLTQAKKKDSYTIHVIQKEKKKGFLNNKEH